MDKGVTCEHLNKLTAFLGKELWHPKEVLSCFDCDCPGPNLWMCLQPDCHHIGCSEVKNDHSTLHQKTYPSHSVHMNVSTERIWCYLCEKEVHIRAALAMSPDYTTTIEAIPAGLFGAVAAAPENEQDPDDMDYDDDSRPRGLVGLQNMGNTCYMNAALQALSNTAPLTSYFMECAASVIMLAADKKPGVSRAYMKLIQEIWNQKTRGYVIPNGILYGIRNVHPMFRGYQQHDTQEFLRCFMDQLHEELKEPVVDRPLEEKIPSVADGDHQEGRSVSIRRRAASSGASDAPLFARMRRKSPAPSSYSDSRADGYSRVQGSESKHRRSASFGGTHLTYAVTHQTNGVPEPDSTQRDSESDSESSYSSDTEDPYETCSSGASDVPDNRSERDAHKPAESCGGGDGNVSQAKFKSIISEVFDGKLLSSVQCLICDRVSTRVETFQDLSLPIPTREHLAVIRCQQPVLNHAALATQESWVWWLLSWLRSWFYGPAVSLQDCLAAFFSADELKGDNMYSCSRCNKLRNGVKMSGVVRLPEVLCVHLKRFRHELMFSAKVAARVSFPLHDLDMAPYTHKECTSKITKYELCAVICHAGTAGGGHYTCVARNSRRWYMFDDQTVTPVSSNQLAHSEAYVLFYKKVNPQMALLRQKAAEIWESTHLENNDIKFYISRQWINKFYTWAEPGPIDNTDFVCGHGGVRPERAANVALLAAVVPPQLWQFLHDRFGGGPAITHAHECSACAHAAERLRARRERELTNFCNLHALFQEQDYASGIYAISMHWFRQWQAFVRNKSQQPPPPIDNTGIVTKQEVDGKTIYILKSGSDHAQLSEELWRFFMDNYGGGPEVTLRAPTEERPTVNNRPSRNHSESDREQYCVKSTSETNIRDSVQYELQKNQSLQNISRRYRPKRAESEDDIAYGRVTNRQEPNGNCPDSEDEANDSTRHVNVVRMENGVDTSDLDANDNPYPNKPEKDTEELPNLERISLRSKPKGGKVRKTKRRTAK